jgi:hypothetical protein
MAAKGVKKTKAEKPTKTDAAVSAPVPTPVPAPAPAMKEASRSSRSMICTGDHVVQGRLGVNTYSPEASIHVKDRFPSVVLEEASTGSVAAIGLERGELMVSGASLISVMGADLRVEGGNLVVNSIDVTATLENLPQEMAREVAKQTGADLSVPVAETVQGLELARAEIGALGGSIEEIHGNLADMISRLTVLEAEHDRIVYNTSLQESVRGLKGVMDGITMANEEIRRRLETLQTNALAGSEAATAASEESLRRVEDLESKLRDVHTESKATTAAALKEMDEITMANEGIRRRLETIQANASEESLRRVEDLESKLRDVHTESKATTAAALKEMDDRIREALEKPRQEEIQRARLEPRIDFLETSILIATTGHQATRSLCEELASRLDEIDSTHLQDIDITIRELRDKVQALETNPAPAPAPEPVPAPELVPAVQALETNPAPEPELVPAVPSALMNELRSEMDEVKKTLSGVMENFGSLSESFMALNAERGEIQKNMNDLERGVTRRMEKGLENVVAMTGYQGKTMQSKLASLSEQYAFSGPLEGMFALGASSMGLRLDLGGNVISQNRGSVYFRLRFVEPPIVFLTIHGEDYPEQQEEYHAMTTEISTTSFSWRATTAAATPKGTVLSWLAIGK